MEVETITFNNIEIPVYEDKFLDDNERMYVIYKYGDILIPEEVARMKRENKLSDIKCIVIKTFNEFTQKDIINVLSKKFK